MRIKEQETRLTIHEHDDDGDDDDDDDDDGILGFGRAVFEFSVLLGCDAASLCNWLLISGDDVVVSSSTVAVSYIFPGHFDVVTVPTDVSRFKSIARH